MDENKLIAITVITICCLFGFLIYQSSQKDIIKTEKEKLEIQWKIDSVKYSHEEKEVFDKR